MTDDSEKVQTPYFEIIKDWWYFYQTESKAKLSHSGFFLYLVEKFNSLFWKKTIGLPTEFTMEVLNISSYNTYKKILNELAEYGFIIIVQRGKNQYDSTKIALSFFNKAYNKARDKAQYKAMIKHYTKQCSDNNTIIHTNRETNKQVSEISLPKYIYSDFDFFKDDFAEIWKNEFIPLKKKKKASVTDRALKSQLNKIKKLSGNNYDIALQILEKTVNSGWTDFYQLKENEIKTPVLAQPPKEKKVFSFWYTLGKGQFQACIEEKDQVIASLTPEQKEKFRIIRYQ